MKSYPPYKIFLNFALVFLCITLFFLIVPGDRYQLKYLLGGVPDQSGEIGRRSGRPPEISGIVHHPLDNIIAESDTLRGEDKIIFPDFISQTSLEYPDGNSEFLHSFIQSIRAIEKNQDKVKILFYGDSQLEGDRITSFFRARLRKEYGSPDSTNQGERVPGVYVESNSQRGSAGLEFTEDSSLLNQYLSGDYPDLIILQFGINVVPARVDDFGYYRNYLVKEVNYIKKQAPGIPIIIIGVSDMGHLVDGIPSSYPSVMKVSRAQREAAKRTGSAYYDLLEFMGGPGSFRKWLSAEPSLMRSDFTHFTFQGGALMAEGLAQTIIAEVNKYYPEVENGE